MMKKICKLGVKYIGSVLLIGAVTFLSFATMTTAISTILPVSTVFAQGNNPSFELIPKVEPDDFRDDVKELSDLNAEKDFWDQYNETAQGYAQDKDDKGLGQMLASGIVTWDTILILLTQLVKFVANAALVFGSAMFIYAGYLYVISAFSSDNTSKANSAIKNAVIGVVIVIFSYAIQKIVTQAFLF